MPTYDYKCDSCGHQFEVYQSMKDDKLTKCPLCGKETLKRLIGTGGGLIFKGSGFYLTDYKNKPAEIRSSAKTKTDSKSEAPTKTAETVSPDNSKTVPVPADLKSQKPEKKSEKISKGKN